jgi:hypothetical protein
MAGTIKTLFLITVEDGGSWQCIQWIAKQGVPREGLNGTNCMNFVRLPGGAALAFLLHRCARNLHPELRLCGQSSHFKIAR